MPQFERPDNDFNNPGSYTDQSGGATDIYTTIDEATADDADFIRTATSPSAAVYVARLSNAEDPLSSSTHVLRWRYAKDGVGAQIDITEQLRQGYVSEASLGTLITSRAFTDVSDTIVQDTYTLTAAEADSITDYNDLFLRFSITQQ